MAALKKTGLTEAVQTALQNEFARQSDAPSLKEKSIAFACALAAKGDPKQALPVDKNFIDSLYEDD